MMFFAWDVNYLQVELAQKLMPTTTATDGANHVVKVLGVPMLETPMIGQNLDLDE
jgi:hypothetical protein